MLREHLSTLRLPRAHAHMSSSIIKPSNHEHTRAIVFVQTWLPSALSLYRQNFLFGAVRQEKCNRRAAMPLNVWCACKCALSRNSHVLVDAGAA